MSPRRNAALYGECASLVRVVDEIARALERLRDDRLAQWTRRSALTLALLDAEGEENRAVVEVQRVLRDLDICARKLVNVEPALRGLSHAEKVLELLERKE